MKNNDKSIEQLKGISRHVRKDVIEMINVAQSGNPGGCLSCVEILVTLYYAVMRPNKDKFILSKGQAAPVLYSILSKKGFFPRNKLWKFRQFKSILQTHPVYKTTPGVDFTTGSLGQGLSGAVGMALGFKYKKSKSNVYTLLGDGELQEGQVWEAAMSAAHYKLDNMVAVVDFNKIQGDGFVKDVMGLGSLVDKWRSFGWEAEEADGHDILNLIESFKRLESIKQKPKIIIAHTIKGKGVSFMENKPKWHVCGVMEKKDYKLALKEIQKR